MEPARLIRPLTSATDCLSAEGGWLSFNLWRHLATLAWARFTYPLYPLAVLMGNAAAGRPSRSALGPLLAVLIDGCETTLRVLHMSALPAQRLLALSSVRRG
jgi:hypothetical protein